MGSTPTSAPIIWRLTQEERGRFSVPLVSARRAQVRILQAPPLFPDQITGRNLTQMVSEHDPTSLLAGPESGPRMGAVGLPQISKMALSSTLARTPALHAGKLGSTPGRVTNGSVSQLAESLAHNREHLSSRLSRTTTCWCGAIGSATDL